MPLDTLEVFGVEYTNVTGIKATDDNGIIKTYIRPQGTKSISSNGTNIDVTEYATVDVAVSASTPNLQDKTATPTTSTQIITADNGYDALQQVTVNPIPSNYIIPTGTIQISDNGTYDVSTYATAEASFASTINNQNKTVTPSESQQTVSADSGYTGLGTVTIEAISSTYVGSGITSRNSTDLSASGATVSVPGGYYAEAASKSVPSGSATAPASITGSSASISTGNGTLTLTKTISVTPSVTAGYISNGTAGDSSVSLTASATIDPTPTASGATVTIPAGYYTAQTTKSVSSMTLPTSAAASATSGYTSKATISRSTSDQYINIPTGYNSAGAYYKISAVANGSATGPSSLSGSSASISTGTNTITLTKTGVTTTPTVSAGYVSAATASTATITLTASVTTKAATTYHPSTTDQTIASGTYTTGAQTIKAVTVSGLSANSILSGTTVKIGDSTDDDCVTSVAGSVVIQHYYTGSSTPSSALGENGDIYLKTS